MVPGNSYERTNEGADKMNKYLDRKHMAEDLPNVKAVRRFRTPAYEAVQMIRAQGEQIEKKNK